jgi:hypothetical protein
MKPIRHHREGDETPRWQLRIARFFSGPISDYVLHHLEQNASRITDGVAPRRNLFSSRSNSWHWTWCGLEQAKDGLRPTKRRMQWAGFENTSLFEFDTLGAKDPTGYHVLSPLSWTKRLLETPLFCGRWFQVTDMGLGIRDT